MSQRVVLDFTPYPVDLIFEHGDGEVAEFVFETSAGVVIDVSDYTWTSQWRERKGAADAVDFDIDDSEAATGVIRLHATAAILAAILAISDRGVWDLQGQIGSDDPQTPVGGNVFLELDVTE